MMIVWLAMAATPNVLDDGHQRNCYILFHPQNSLYGHEDSLLSRYLARSLPSGMTDGAGYWSTANAVYLMPTVAIYPGIMLVCVCNIILSMAVMNYTR